MSVSSENSFIDIRFTSKICFSWFAMLCFALLCFAMLCFALLCFALLCFALLCFALSPALGNSRERCLTRSVIYKCLQNCNSCKHFKHTFSMISGTIFAHHKLSLQTYIFAMKSRTFPPASFSETSTYSTKRSLRWRTKFARV